uniref:Uncharacterized protein n=1 Tax=uncultured prokaryote TaxID=198431 RepID=A0A0H5Q637_9ZZZZ|nr:hypothetical protein [uncultured prokaryote]
MSSLADAILDETRRLACRVLSDDNAAAGFLSRGLRTNPIGVVVATGLGELRDNAASFACDPGGSPGRAGDSLTGTAPPAGQCAGVQYDVTWSLVATFAGGPRNETRTSVLDGPIGEISYDVSNSTGLTVSIVSNGVVTRVLSRGGSASNWDVESVVIDSVVRGDGLPDDCGVSGDPRPRYEGPIFYQDENGNNVNDDVVIVLDDPSSGGGGGLTIPFGWFAPELEINPELKLNVDPEIDFSPGGQCRPDLEFEPGSDIPDGDDDPPPPPDSRLLAGVIVVTTVEDPNRVPTVTGGDALSLFFPDCGSVVFAVRVGNEVAWTGPKPIRVLKQWEPVLGELYAYSFRIVNRNGFVSQGYPVYLDDGETQD